MATDCLRFLGAAMVASPAGTLAGLQLCSRDDDTVGTVEGVLIDPPARRIRYFVIKRTGSAEQYLLSADTPVHVEEGPRVGRLESDRAELQLELFDPNSVSPFTEEDAVTAMFARAAA